MVVASDERLYREASDEEYDESEEEKDNFSRARNLCTSLLSALMRADLFDDAFVSEIEDLDRRVKRGDMKEVGNLLYLVSSSVAAAFLASPPNHGARMVQVEAAMKRINERTLYKDAKETVESAEKLWREEMGVIREGVERMRDMSEEMTELQRKHTKVKTDFFRGEPPPCTYVGEGAGSVKQLYSATTICAWAHAKEHHFSVYDPRDGSLHVNSEEGWPQEQTTVEGWARMMRAWREAKEAEECLNQMSRQLSPLPTREGLEVTDANLFDGEPDGLVHVCSSFLLSSSLFSASEEEVKRVVSFMREEEEYETIPCLVPFRDDFATNFTTELMLVKRMQAVTANMLTVSISATLPLRVEEAAIDLLLFKQRHDTSYKNVASKEAEAARAEEEGREGGRMVTETEFRKAFDFMRKVTSDTRSRFQCKKRVNDFLQKAATGKGEEEVEVDANRMGTSERWEMFVIYLEETAKIAKANLKKKEQKAREERKRKRDAAGGEEERDEELEEMEAMLLQDDFSEIVGVI